MKIKIVDTRASALCDKCSRVFEEPEDPDNRTFFTEIIASISDIRYQFSLLCFFFLFVLLIIDLFFVTHSFGDRGRYIVSRDYLSLKIWDLHMESKPVKTINIHLGTLGTFCRWLEARGDLQGNPCSGQAVRGGSQAAQDQRLAFNASEVRTLLDVVDKEAPTRGIAGFVWAMAYTGARNEEIAQLRVCDLSHFGDTRIACFDLATVDDNQARKTSASRRLVPAHNQLLSYLGTRMALRPSNATEVILCNLWGFAQKTRTKRYSYDASRWVNESLLPRLKREGLIRDDARLTLYSLRHAVLTQLKHKGVPEVQIAELRGTFYEDLPKAGDYYKGHVLNESTIKLLNSFAGSKISITEASL